METPHPKQTNPEDELRKSYHELETLLNNTDEIFLTLDKDLNIVTFNKNAREASVRYLKNELKKGTSYLNYAASPDRVDHLRKLLSEALAGERKQTDYVFDLENGGKAYFTTIIKPIINSAGAADGVFVIERDVTEMVVRQNQIDFDRENLDALINSTADMMWSIGTDYRLITCNRAFEDTVKYMTGHPVTKGSNVIATGFDDEQLKRWRGFYERAFSGETFTITEYTAKPIEFWSEVSFYPIREGEKVIGTACYSHNITEKKKQEKKISESDERFKAEQKRFADLFLQAPSAICILKGDNHVYEMANPFYLELSGKKDIIGKTAAEVFPELVEQGFFDLLNHVYKTGEPFTGKEVLMHINRDGDGKFIDYYVNFVYQPYKNTEGKTEGMFFFGNDVTELVLAKRKTEQSEKRFRAITENNFDAITLTDENGNLVYQSPAAARILGDSVEDSRGKKEEDFFHPDDTAEVLARVDTALQNPGTAVYGIHRLKHKDGHYIWAEGTTTNLLHDKDVKAIVGNFRDVTERKTAEEKLIKANRLIAFVSEINKAVVRIKTEDALFTEACQIAVNTGKFQLAWIGAINELNKTIDLVAHCSTTDSNMELFNDIQYNNDGPVANVLKKGTYHLINNWDEEPIFPNIKKYAGLRGFKSGIALPIVKHGKTIATFNLCSTQSQFFDEQEIGFLEEITNDISFAIDIFEKEKHRKQIEEKLTKSELQLKHAQNIAHFGNWTLDLVTGDTEWSEEACRIYGLDISNNVMPYQAWLSFIHPGDLDYVMKVIKDHEVTLSDFSFHHRIILQDGSVKHIFSQVQYELNAEGKPIGLYGVAHDETDTKEAEMALEQSEANMRLIMDLIPQSIFAKDYNGKYVFMNKSYADLFGQNTHELINKTAWETVPLKKESEAFMEEDREVISSGKTIIIPEHVFTNPNGEAQIFRTIKVPFMVAGTNKKAVLGIAENITKEKQTEAERNKMIHDIVQRNKDLEQFSYIVSHNLRGPVSSILGLVDLLQAHELDSQEETECITGLLTSTRKIDTVIRDLNTILKLKHNEQKNNESVKFSDIVNEVRLSIDQLIRKENVLISGDFSSVDEIITLKGYIHSIFLNLITNSIKYRQKDIDPTIRISSAKAGNKVLLTFKDNGMGFDLNKVGDKVFGLYKRFHLHIEGKGMGLFMVKTQVESLGGTIKINSEVNKGAEFIIELPLQ